MGMLGLDMAALSLPFQHALPVSKPADGSPPKHDWPLMGDVATCRAGVPEALIHWRAARGEAPPLPCDADLRSRR